MVKKKGQATKGKPFFQKPANGKRQIRKPATNQTSQPRIFNYLEAKKKFASSKN